MWTEEERESVFTDQRNVNKWRRGGDWSSRENPWRRASENATYYNLKIRAPMETRTHTLPLVADWESRCAKIYTMRCHGHPLSICMYPIVINSCFHSLFAELAWYCLESNCCRVLIWIFGGKFGMKERYCNLLYSSRYIQYRWNEDCVVWEQTTWEYRCEIEKSEWNIKNI